MSCGVCSHWLTGKENCPACKHTNAREIYVEQLKNEVLKVAAECSELSTENARLLAENAKLLEEVAPWRQLHPLTVSLIKMVYGLK